MMESEAREIPQVVELPNPETSGYDQILYWHTSVSYPDASEAGEARCTRLIKDSRTISMEIWKVKGVYKTPDIRGKSKGITPREHELAVAKAYERMTDSEREQDGTLTKPVIIQGHPAGLKVVMTKKLWCFEMAVWRDEGGRVWLPEFTT